MQKPRIILWDIETLPNAEEIIKVFPSLSNYPGLTLKASINSIICVGWKELGSKKVNCINAWDFKEWKKDVNNDRNVVEAAYKILKDADAVITHNGRSFDWKFLQTRLYVHGLPPLPKIIHIDTKCEAKKHLFAFNNKLDTLGKLLAQVEKLKHEGWSMWPKVHARDPKAMKLMTKYCKQDVVVLEKVFEKLRPLITSIPNYNLFSLEKNRCPKCGSLAIKKEGTKTTKTRVVQQLKCLNCYSWFSIGLRDHIPRSL